MPPPFGSSAPITTRSMRAKLMAAAHIVQGSSDTYSVVFGILCAPCILQASRMDKISAWADGSFNSRVRLLAEAIISPVSFCTRTAPIGTSSLSNAFFASSNAACMKLWSASVKLKGLFMSSEDHKGERIAKRIARAGICSRRDAERWINEGRVAVNGKVLDTPAFLVVESDKIVVDCKPIGGAEDTRLWLYHKPSGLVTTHKDERGRDTVFDKLPEGLPRVVSVGRLDLNTEGLLLLTNDGALSRYLELPSTGWGRKYRVRVMGRVNPKRLEALEKGITVDGVRYGSIKVQVDQAKEGANSWLTMVLKEGKNREIRRVMEAFGLKVNRLIRVSYGPFELGKLERGGVIEVKPNVVRAQIPKFFKEQG